MSELLKNMALNGYGIAWLPIWSIVDELQTKRLRCTGNSGHYHLFFF